MVVKIKMPGTMSLNSLPTNSIASSSSSNTSPSTISHKRSSLCCPPSENVGSALSQHRRSSLQHPLSINFKSTYKENKDVSLSGGFKKGDDKLVVVLSAAESGSYPSNCNNAHGWPSESAQQNQVGFNERSRTPSDEQRIPDSTTSQLEGKHSFSSGDDVFVKQKDGRYYLGTVMRSSPGGERWLVRFGDETERWAGGNELRPLGMGCDENEERVLCVVCKVRGSSSEVIACDKCGRGYHKECHSPDNDALSPGHSLSGISWQCKRCVEQRFKAAASENRAMRREMLKRQIIKPPEMLPYNLNALHWDNQHRENTEEKYCYCGKTGNWFKKMLQCVRCKQWFHQACISCLRHPLYPGDRFYVFACSICNAGSEFLRRIELDWVDLVHLMIFNLTVYHSKKYYDLDTIIIPYTMDNWYALQLPAVMQALTPSQRREKIVQVLTSNRNRFKCGRETKKRASIWGLRGRDPPAPPPPTSPLPSRGPITEAVLINRIAFISETDSPTSSQDCGKETRMIVPIDSHWVSVMSGRRFQDISSDNDSMASSPSPVDDIVCINRLDMLGTETPDIFTSMKESFNLDKANTNEKLSTPVAKRKELKFYEMNYEGCGFVKKSVSVPKLTLNKRKKFLDSLRQRCELKEEPSSVGEVDKDESGNKNVKLVRTRLAKQQEVTHMSIGTNTPPVEDETVFTLIDTRTNISVTSNVLKATKESSHYSYESATRKDILPPTPPTSISAPSTPPATSGASTVPSSTCSSLDAPPSYHSNKTVQYDSDQEKSVKSSSSSEDTKVLCQPSTPTKTKTQDSSPPIKDVEQPPQKEVTSIGYNSKMAAINLEISKLSTKNIVEHSKIMSLHHMNDTYSIFKVDHDSSGDDTSSRGTLDSIIPPPANFQGENNPFHWQENNHQKGVSIASKLFNRLSYSKLQSVTTKGLHKNSRISLPINLNPVIMPPARPLKRHLSEKDLVIGPNGEVKRRRLRRPRKALQIPHNQTTKDQTMNERQKSLRSSIGQVEVSAGKPGNDAQTTTTTFVNIEMSNQQINTCTEYSQNGRTLRQRQEKNYCDGRRGSAGSNNANALSGSSGVRTLNLSPKKSSPFKSSPSDSVAKETMHELKNSVHSYFGALNRIGAGEKFTLMGKRLTENGDVQYLIEWEGHGS